MKVAVILSLFIGSALSVSVQRIEVQTSSQPLNDLDGVQFTVHDVNLNECTTLRFTGRDGLFGVGQVQTLTGADLGDCTDPTVFDSDIRDVTIAKDGIHEWTFSYISVFTSDGKSCTTWSGQSQGEITFKLPCS